MKKSKILLIALFVAIFVIGLCFCTPVKAAEMSYFGLVEKSNNWIKPLKTPKGLVYLTTQEAKFQVEIKADGEYVKDMTPFNLSIDNEEVAKINEETGEITILSEGEFSVLADNKVQEKVKIISAEGKQKWEETHAKAKEVMDDIQIENEDKTAGLSYGYDSPFRDGCMMGIATLQLTDKYGKNLAETFPDVTYEVLDNSLLSIDKNGKITGNKDITKGGETEIFINLGNDVYTSIYMSVVYGWDGYLSWRDDYGFPAIGQNGEPSTTNPEQTPSTTPTENQPQRSETAKSDELDDEPKAGISTSVEFFVGGLAIISLAVAVIAKKH